MTIPTLNTERLLLRAHVPADLPAFVAIFQEPAFYHFLSRRPLPEDEVWTKMLRNMAPWLLLGYGFWAVEEKATGQFIGAVGFAEWHRPIEPSLKGYPEVGWVLAAHTHGRGYGLEASQAALAWGDVHLPERRTVCLIDVANAPSLRLAAKCGYHEFSRTDYKGETVVLLERIAAR